MKYYMICKVSIVDMQPFMFNNINNIKDYKKNREKGITTLRIYQYRIFYHSVIETCFDMLKS